MGGPSGKSAANVRVVVRIRPLSSTERSKKCKESIVCVGHQFGMTPTKKSGPEVLEVLGPEKRYFEYDAVLDQSSSQIDVYTNSGAQNAVQNQIFKGYNATLLAYGQTGAGKTYTMGTFGDTNPVHNGILPRACDDLFATIQEKCDGNGTVELSYLEIYNEEIRDLLSSDTPAHPEKKSPHQLKIRETLNGEVYVSGLIAKPVGSPVEIGEVLEEASKRRVVGSTAMNAVSSRSHAICTFKIKGVLEGGEKFSSKLTLVDLAGSERIKKTGAQGSRRLEGIHINQSLMVLGQVVSALGDGRKRRPPYRDSKLTRLLQDSLGGNSRTIMLACVSPADYNLEESVNTLRYATSARNIKNSATRNLVQQITPEEAAALQRENQLLKQEVADLREMVKKLSMPSMPTSSISIVSGNTEELDDDMSTSNHQETARVQELEREVKKLTKQLEGAKTDLRQTTQGMAVELPALKVQVSRLEEELKQKGEVEEENENLRRELEHARADASGARMAASKLEDIMEQLKSLKQDEVNKKQVQLKHKLKEREWVDFIAKILDRRTDQLKQLREDFELVIKVVESPAVYQTEERKNWFGRKEYKEIYDPALRERVLLEHVSFFKDRMDEIQNDIFVRAISLQGIRDRINAQCQRMSQEIDTVQLEAISMETREQDVLAKLVDMLIEQPVDGTLGEGKRVMDRGESVRTIGIPPDDIGNQPILDESGLTLH